MHKKKQKLLLIALAVVAVLSVAAVIFVLSYDHIDHGTTLSKSEISQYNIAITAAARSYKAITSSEIVIIDTVSKELGGHTEITFRVYQLPEGKTDAAYMELRVSDLPADFAPDHLGNGTARLVNGSKERIIVNVTYHK